MTETCLMSAPKEAPVAPRRYPTMPAKERALWARHLEIKDALASAGLKGDLRGVRKLEEELKLLEDQIYAPWRRRKKEAHPVAERFSYRIPVIEAETGRVKGHLVADQDGVHRPEALQDPLPPNDTRRPWLKVLEPSKAARQGASRTWHATDHTGRPRCPGCRGRKDLTYLEFRNGEGADRLKTLPVLAVCDKTAVSLLVRSRREIFGVTALGSRLPWPCLEAADSAALVHEEPLQTQPAGPGRGGWRGKPGSLAALQRHRAGGSAPKALFMSAKPASGGLPCSHTAESVSEVDPAHGTASKKNAS